MSEWWHFLIPPEHSGKATIAFLIGVLLPWPLNWLGEQKRFPQFNSLSDEASVDREVEKKRNPLEALLHQAMKNWSIVSVSVKNGKVYIGRVTNTINPGFGMQAINLVLRRSGHRDKDTQKMTLDVDYYQTHAAIKRSLRQKLVQQLMTAIRENPSATEREWVDIASLRVAQEPEIRNFVTAIPITEVQSANVFDMSIYDEFFAPEEEVVEEEEGGESRSRLPAILLGLLIGWVLGRRSCNG